MKISTDFVWWPFFHPLSSPFYKGKIIQTKVAYFSEIQNHTKYQDPKLLLLPQNILQEPCLIAGNVWCEIQWHDIYTTSTEVNAECTLTTVQPHALWPRNPMEIPDES